MYNKSAKALHNDSFSQINTRNRNMKTEDTSIGLARQFYRKSAWIAILSLMGSVQLFIIMALIKHIYNTDIAYIIGVPSAFLLYTGIFFLLVSFINFSYMMKVRMKDYHIRNLYSLSKKLQKESPLFSKILNDRYEQAKNTNESDTKKPWAFWIMMKYFIKKLLQLPLIKKS
jgi:hypothetical protein